MAFVQSMETMNPMDVPWEEAWNWTNDDFDNYTGYYSYSNYGDMGYMEALYTFFIWETWISIKKMASKNLLYPAFLYTLSVACIAIAINARERYRAAWVTASIAIGAAIIQYISKTDFVYVIKDTMVRLVIIHNLGSVVMILWEKFCLTEEQKRLPWGQRAIATYKIMWNSRFVNTSRPAPVFHLLKADEERQKAVLCATIEKDEAEELNNNIAPAEQADHQNEIFPYTGKAWNAARQVSHRTWGCISWPVARLWNWFSPRTRWIVKTTGIVTAVWVSDRVIDQIAQVVIVFDWDDVELHKIYFFRRLHEVTSREIVIRCFFAFQAVWSAYAFYTMIHSTIAIFFVALRIDEPEEWPSVFGDIRQAWNLRRFWSKYWDRLIYRAVNGLGEMFMTVIGLGPRPFRGKKRWLLNGLVFAISGIFHALTDYFSGIHCSYMWELWWWNMNFVGIVGETALLYSIQACFPRLYYKMSGKTGKAVGFLWVFAWLFWASPKNQFTAMHCLPENR
ncbi:toxin biosynthesis protein [Colletotrichum tofieldiae]|uniref:Toxin biosynthesis protein n=1 Tax=Colletotrichum tofieldiae TaxID=708197 RepID=A0A166MB95_9PEZI|nr:toxin biosynthesis protein [Colletotrichum tofieldiae]GKT86156.1 toxin biosynthesis protein [Colletotrichum tofieldiae]